MNRLEVGTAKMHHFLDDWKLASVFGITVIYESTGNRHLYTDDL